MRFTLALVALVAVRSAHAETRPGYYTSAGISGGWIAGTVTATGGSADPADHTTTSVGDGCIVPRLALGLALSSETTRGHIGAGIDFYQRLGGDGHAIAVGLQAGIGAHVHPGLWISGRGSASFAAGKYPIIDQSKLFTLGVRAHFEMFETGVDVVLIRDNGYERVDGYGLLASLGVSGVPRHPILATAGIALGSLMMLGTAASRIQSH